MTKRLSVSRDRKQLETPTWATAIHLSMVCALWAGLVWAHRGEFGKERGDEMGEEVEGLGEVEQRREVMTRLVTALNWEMVARTVGARFRFSFLSRWDQTQPRHWKGTALTNSSWGTHNSDERAAVWRKGAFGKNRTYSVQSGQLLRHLSHGEVHEVKFVFLFGQHVSSVLPISVVLLQRLTAVLWRRLAVTCQTHWIISDDKTSCSDVLSVCTVQ